MSDPWSDASAAWNETVQPHIDEAVSYGNDIAAAGTQGVSELGSLMRETAGTLLEEAGMVGSAIEDWLNTLTEAELSVIGALFQAANALRTAGTRLDDAGNQLVAGLGRPLSTIFTQQQFQNAATVGGAIREALGAATVAMQAFNSVIDAFPGDQVRRQLTDFDPRFARWLDHPENVSP